MFNLLLRLLARLIRTPHFVVGLQLILSQLSLVSSIYASGLHTAGEQINVAVYGVLLQDSRYQVNTA